MMQDAEQVKAASWILQRRRKVKDLPYEDLKAKLDHH